MNNYKALVKEAFSKVLIDPAFNEEMIARYFDPSYRQLVDGKELNYEQFVAHMAMVKQRTTRLEFLYNTVIEEGNVVFTNHIVTATKPNGEIVRTHLIAEFHIANGKITYCSELSRLLSGGDEDRDLGSAH
ncbi:nuclear transport factor 2 family protein [Chitinophaga pinensis]|uniref:Nuclear transport factor 2 family protein n=1 Tax=Chitinophaga pinensis TaxID=79329 RepID=A0A5C6LTK6_9BACT|nr:nuclear transport factor 2 family protein [Chitinophaga pinensis]TWV99906.1 nuclear transport factor 2 family protein [Chitinophaga pinensis]